MIYEIRNSLLNVKINDIGAELTAITNKKTGEEYLWDANPEFWGKHSPVLFPYIGRMFGEKVIINGQEYKALKHGFISKRVFKPSSISESSITLFYKSNEEDLPFIFDFNITFTLENNKLTVSTSIENLDKETMHFALGFHPAFNIKSDFEKHSLVFEKEHLNERIMSKDCFALNETKEFNLINKTIQLNRSLFDNDAKVFHDYGVAVVLKDANGKDKIKLRADDYPVLTVWNHAHSQDPFLCIEPCTSIPGFDNTTDDITTRKDYIHLKVNEKKTLKFDMEFN